MVQRNYLHRGLSGLDNLFKLYPALLVLLGLLNGMAPLIPDYEPNPAYLVFSLPFILMAGLMGRKILVNAIICTLLGMVITYWHSHRPADHYANQGLPKNCGALIKVTVADPACAERTIDWLPNPTLLTVSSRSMKFTEGDVWRPVSGTLAVRLPDLAPPVEYGDILLLTGNLAEPEPALFPGDFDFKRYLFSIGIDQIFYASGVEMVGREPGFYFFLMSRLLRYRDHCLRALATGLSLDNRRLLAAMLFGCKQGLDHDDRRVFLLSGAIHLFAISGMNVGMLALIFFGFTRFLPFSWRYTAVSLLLILFVATIGFQPSAVRALLMICLWSFFRAFLYTLLPLNVVFLTAALILVCSPAAIFSAGFQYSFLVTGFLICSWQEIRKWQALCQEKTHWLPAGRRSPWTVFRLNMGSKVIATGLSSTIATLAGSGLTLFYQGLQIPLAVLANFLIVPLVWFIFLFSALKFFSLPLGLPAALLTRFLECFLDAISGVCRFISFYGAAGFVLPPPFWTLPVFYFFLFRLIGAEKKARFLVAALVLTALFTGWNLRRQFAADSVVIFRGGQSQEPAVMVCCPGLDRAFLVNVPSPETARKMVNYLARSGFNRVETLIITRNQKDFCAGAASLLAAIEVGELWIPPQPGRSPYAGKVLAAAAAARTEIIPMAPVSGPDSAANREYCRFPVKFSAGPNQTAISLDLNGRELTLRFHDNGLGKRRVTLLRPDHPEIRRSFLNRATVTYTIIPF